MTLHDDLRDSAVRQLRDVQEDDYCIVGKENAEYLLKLVEGERNAEERLEKLLAAIHLALKCDTELAKNLPTPPQESAHTHKWDLDGERCVICGQKDWMSDAVADSGDPQPQENTDAET